MQTTTNIVRLRPREDSKAMSTSISAYGQGNPEDLRQERREVSGRRLFVQITQAADSELVGTTMSCTSVVASAHGIKFLVEHFIPVGCLLDLWVDDESRLGKFFLSGDVRWTHKAGLTSTLVGVRLQEG